MRKTGTPPKARIFVRTDLGKLANVVRNVLSNNPNFYNGHYADPITVERFGSFLSSISVLHEQARDIVIELDTFLNEPQGWIDMCEADARDDHTKSESRTPFNFNVSKAAIKSELELLIATIDEQLGPNSRIATFPYVRNKKCLFGNLRSGPLQEAANVILLRSSLSEERIVNLLNGI